jgi:N-acetylneuraminate synthase
MIELWAEAGKCGRNVDEALKFAESAVNNGASALKVQWYNPEAVFVPDAPRYDKTGGSATTQWEAEKDPLYPYELWEPVVDYCHSQNLRFIPSVFDKEAVDVADKFGLPTLKIASGDITYHELIRYASEGRQLALSTGASTLEEVELAVEQLDHTSGFNILMACHLEYPTPYHRANIARTFVLQEHFPYMMPGFSDHTPGVDTIPLIVATGCQVIEKHFTLEKGKGYDSDFALDPAELLEASKKIQGTLSVMGDSYLSADPSEDAAREGARRSPYARNAIPAGQVIVFDDLVMLRPSYGPTPQQGSRFVGLSFEDDIPALGKFPVLGDSTEQ